MGKTINLFETELIKKTCKAFAFLRTQCTTLRFSVDVFSSIWGLIPVWSKLCWININILWGKSNWILYTRFVGELSNKTTWNITISNNQSNNIHQLMIFLNNTFEVLRRLSCQRFFWNCFDLLFVIHTLYKMHSSL